MYKGHWFSDIKPDGTRGVYGTGWIDVKGNFHIYPDGPVPWQCPACKATNLPSETSYWTCKEQEGRE